ncbi:alpha-galactosidase [Klebsormidium nitens]|uniref:Alpha-galactosidase n=1 Tax=Klebsormidium nitens TaxID=105231 RepID=A0A1Y1HW19_KLENI|nr:alpha-galactosidase [Klebsormidium nitens]|eukprot:GAQ81181.1 alpha-galactosidase [Klebsormidium nitens]
MPDLSEGFVSRHDNRHVHVQGIADRAGTRALSKRRQLLGLESSDSWQDGMRGRRTLENGLGRTPPMGWSSWNAEGVNITEQEIRHAADALVATGLRDAGYIYVNLDDGWAGWERDANGDLTVDEASFPSGIRSLADYIHSKGLKFGIYSSAGPKACSGRLGSLLHEDQDARWFADHGVDFLKYDSCDDGKSGLGVKERFVRMRDALAKLSRPIYFAMGYWNEDTACAAGPVGNSWRTFFDIYSDVNRVFLTADKNNEYAACQGPHFGWNDADALQIGRLSVKPGGDPDLEAERTQMTLWSIMKSPLIIGYDPSQMGSKRLAILKNREVIAINQDPLGKQATKRFNSSDWDVWAGPLTGGRVVVALVNRNRDAVQQILVDWRTVGLESDARMTARDVWRGANLPGTHATNMGPFPVAPHGTVLLILSPVQSPWSSFWTWEPFGGGFVTPWIIAVGLALVSLVGFSVFFGTKRFRGWAAQGPSGGAGAGYKRSSSDSKGERVPLHERPERESPIRTQRSGLKREASTRISRSRTGDFDAV